jgi:hypothetical protein
MVYLLFGLVLILIPVLWKIGKKLAGYMLKGWLTGYLEREQAAFNVEYPRWRLTAPAGSRMPTELYNRWIQLGYADLAQGGQPLLAANWKPLDQLHNRPLASVNGYPCIPYQSDTPVAVESTSRRC